ncbi:helix-turn-helix domain-containing protein [Pseudonocardia sp. ICBG601]|uniref:helix-turn-helix domain-containing protein n=1 Tax=Pseudonocardia sp. ICBG601 TaxID=2846759 RepID=UPI0035ABB69A
MTPGRPGSSAPRLLPDAGPTVSIAETARALGVSRDLIYAMHARGELAALGIKVLRLGSRIRVSTASLRTVLDSPSTADVP